jgi:hypothetical protein
MVLALWCGGAPAQQPESPIATLELLARVGCESGAAIDGNIDIETGYVAMLGVAGSVYSFRVMHSGVHALMIPAAQCGRGPLQAGEPFLFILTHSFQNAQRVRESYYYLMNQRGQLVNAVHYQDGRSHLFAYVSTDVPVRRADFEAEKIIWLSGAASVLGAR